MENDNNIVTTETTVACGWARAVMQINFAILLIENKTKILHTNPRTDGPTDPELDFLLLELRAND